MAEDFIEEIYVRADVIESMREICNSISKMRIQEASNLWNASLPMLLNMVNHGCESGMDQAGLKAAISEAHEAWGDPLKFAYVIEKRILPELYGIIKDYTGIEAQEGRYVLQSSQAGYLTLFDSEQNLYLHSLYDPMWEAKVFAEAIWKAGIEEIHILGCGLGYLAYQLWKKSYENLKIYIYEPDEKIVSYAKRFGVLERIDKNAINVITGKNLSEVEKAFEDFSRGKEKSISLWAGKELEKIDGGRTAQNRMEADVARWFYDLWIENYKRNKKKITVSINDLRRKFTAEEFVVVAAGPSVDDRIDWLREMQGKRCIIAVDVILKRLVKEGIRPDIVVTADPQNHLVHHIEGIENETKDIVLVAERFSNCKFLNVYQGATALVISAGLAEAIDENQPQYEIWDFSGTVSSLGIETAIQFGAKRVWLVGLDLAYPGGKQFASGTMHKNAIIGRENENLIESVQGTMVETTQTFLYFKRIIERQIEKYTSVEFVNMSLTGAKIKGAINNVM